MRDTATTEGTAAGACLCGAASLGPRAVGGRAHAGRPLPWPASASDAPAAVCARRAGLNAPWRLDPCGPAARLSPGRQGSGAQRSPLRALTRERAVVIGHGDARLEAVADAEAAQAEALLGGGAAAPARAVGRVGLLRGPRRGEVRARVCAWWRWDGRRCLCVYVRVGGVGGRAQLHAQRVRARRGPPRALFRAPHTVRRRPRAAPLLLLSACAPALGAPPPRGGSQPLLLGAARCCRG